MGYQSSKGSGIGWAINDEAMASYHVRHHQQHPNSAHHGSHSLSGEPRTGIINRVQIQLTMETTHILESQGQVSSAGSKSSSPQKPLTNWRAKDRHHQQSPNPAHHGSHSRPEEVS